MTAAGDEYVCGGYFLFVPQPWTREPGFERADSCLWEGAAFFPDSWAVEWASDEKQARDGAAAFGLTPVEVPQLRAEVTRLFAAGVFRWPNVIPDLATARRLRAMLPASTAITLVGVAFAAADTPELRAATAPPPQQPGFAPLGAAGVHEMLADPKPLSAGFAELLGFDGVTLDGGGIGNGLSDIPSGWLEQRCGPRNANKLFADFDSAARASGTLTGNPEIGTPRRFWPALVVRYPV